MSTICIPTVSDWDWACGRAAVNWTATDLSAGRVTTHYAALKNTEASFWYTGSLPGTHTWLIFHWLFPWLTISRFMSSAFATIELMCCLFLEWEVYYFSLFCHPTGSGQSKVIHRCIMLQGDHYCWSKQSQVRTKASDKNDHCPQLGAVITQGRIPPAWHNMWSFRHNSHKSNVTLLKKMTHQVPDKRHCPLTA